ncbi:membrane protein [Microvirga aerophila]|uniref:Membrane protein n=2 Tax=Microvirga aerophila TaxID=670291 RepID=A0A512BMI5_9HYPH|nr:membrane protein [Microvirga aerophila]
MSFSGRGREFLRLLVTGSLFQIPTFGFYRFWLITKLRRHLWANTQVGGEAFEYTGTAKELLIGFLIALAVLTPIYLGYFILGIIAEEQKALASIPLVLIMYVLMHFASYRVRRCRATRTVFRGVRFWMKGSGWAYAMRAILWDIATMLTLGLALPWATASLERYRMRHTYFGSIQGSFTRSGWGLFKRGWWVWGLGMASILGALALLTYLDAIKAKNINIFGGVILLLPIPVVLALLPLVMAIFTRWQMEGLRVGEVAVSSNLAKGAFYGTFLKLIFSSIGFLLVFGVLFSLGGYLFVEKLQALQLGEISWETGSVIVLGALAYLALLLGMGIIQRYFMGRGLWAVVVNSITVSNLQAVNAAVAAGQPSGVLGEGLADALDFEIGI